MATVEKRRMCPNCRAFITTDDKVCPYCDMKVGPRAVERRVSADVGFISSARFTTVIILLINAGLFAATVLLSLRATGGSDVMSVHPEVLRFFGAKSVPDMILYGEWWRLITAGFLHGGVIHILMNSWVIFDLGATVEEFYGTSRYLVLYFVSTVAGFIASSWWSPASLSIGASAALFGLIGAMIAFGMRSGSSIGSALRTHYTQWAIYGLLMGLLPFLLIDNAAHIGGLVAGFAIGYIAGTPGLQRTWADKAWKAAAAFCVLLTLAAFALMLRRFASAG
jgi:rhomboid protease GluP